MELANQTLTAADISVETEVLSYESTAVAPVEVVARVDLGDTDNPLGGAGGSYVANLYVNGILVSPATTVNVAAGVLRTIIVSRPVPLVQDDVLSIRVTGQTTDLSVTIVARLRDATPAKAHDLAGDGTVEVDHNYLSTDRYRIIAGSGAGIPNVLILAYLTEDYLAGSRGDDFVRGRSTTGNDGRWRSSMRLDPDDYTLVFSKAGELVSTTRSLPVA